MDKLTKMVRVALSSDNAGEITAAIGRARAHMSKDNITAGMIFLSAGQEQEPARDLEIWRRFVMPWGKHKGVTIGHLMGADPDYIFWLDKNATSMKRGMVCAVKAAVRELGGDCE